MRFIIRIQGQMINPALILIQTMAIGITLWAKILLTDTAVQSPYFGHGRRQRRTMTDRDIAEIC